MAPMRRLRLLGPALVLAAFAACSSTAPVAVAPSPSGAGSAPPSPSPSGPEPGAPVSDAPGPAPPASPIASACGDPTAHVYHAYRLQLIDSCRTVTGVLTTVRSEADGDYHILLNVDPQFAPMLRPANANERGDLVLEPICQHRVTQADAVQACSGGVPLVPIPPVGTHVSATGTYVLDNQHGGWAELHPLFELHAG